MPQSETLGDWYPVLLIAMFNVCDFTGESMVSLDAPAVAPPACPLPLWAARVSSACVQPHFRLRPGQTTLLLAAAASRLLVVVAFVGGVFGQASPPVYFVFTAQQRVKTQYTKPAAGPSQPLPSCAG